MRTHGWGNTKNARGAGTRGGRGKAGSHKHQYSKYFAQFGTEEKQVRSRRQVTAVNLDAIAQHLSRWIEKKIAVQNGKTVELDAEKAGFNKVLSRGTPTGAWTIRGATASAVARQKIEKAGGRVVAAGETDAAEPQKETP